MSRNRKAPASGWELAARLCENLMTAREKAGTALDRYANRLSCVERRHCQRLFFGAVRHQRLIDTTVAKLVSRSPRRGLRGLLFVAMGELLESPAERYPQIIDFWVGKTRQQLSRGEAGLANAVLRRAPQVWDAVAESGDWGLRHSHPAWLVGRWQRQFGEAVTLALLEHNQQPAEVFFRLRGDWPELPPGCEVTAWPGFVRWVGGDWAVMQDLLAQGRLYAQDPGTRLAPGLLAVQSGERVLDLCAAPGGKSLLLADAMGRGELVAVDQPGPRLAQLEENLQKLSTREGFSAKLVAADVRTLDPAVLGLFDAVLLDAPCTNTGVLRRRPDAKWRLTEDSVAEMSTLQLELLQVAARLVRPGGRLVYSTCSIEAEENTGVVQTFLANESGFRLAGESHSLPHLTGHDGAGAFRLERVDC